MSFREFVEKYQSIVQRERKQRGGHLALLVDYTNPDTSKLWAGKQGAYRDETAAVGIFRSTSQGQPNDLESRGSKYYLFLTYQPTEMCMGLAWRAGVQRVYWGLENGSILYRVARPHPYPDIHQTGWKTQTEGEDDPRLKKQVFLSGRNYNDDRLETKLNTGIRNIAMPITSGSDPVVRNLAYMQIAYALVGSAWNEELGGDEKGLRPGSSQRRPYGNNIGGILVDSQSNRIIGWGLNMKHLNKCYHGETLLILHYLSTKNVDRLPDGSLFYTSLEPCHMCSGFITTVGGDSGHFRSNRRTGLRQKCIAARMWPEWVVCSMQANRIQNAGLHDSRSDEKKSESKNGAVSV